MRILRAADYRVMPWKNGGGTTTEIVVWPNGAGLDDFDWRISMARVEGSGPFSKFAGIDRTLAILEGEGIVLDIAGRAPASINRATALFSFPADVPTSATLVGGPITDLNVMTRRGRTTHSVERLVVSAPVEIRTEPGTTLVLCPDGEVVIAAAEPVRLGPLDTLLVERDTASQPAQPTLLVRPNHDTTLFVIRIRGND
ncbi:MULTISPECIES: HutD family protein [unclassified Mesorhizobium]|uniref:HutD/Ves family protein n=1 Tax=unclassified Mesorhizobium TaxID=325217 RepID=UPI00112CBEA9|nr:MULTISPECIES: HutD family protein [unclassified Mesorhizobium]TPN54014.1 HutD family protein [Mesorhizobium sp. B1-1-7]TPN54309.1 HutD family protein [Mesorhizobium sp. B1-1-9]